MPTYRIAKETVSWGVNSDNSGSRGASVHASAQCDTVVVGHVRDLHCGGEVTVHLQYLDLSGDLEKTAQRTADVARVSVAIAQWYSRHNHVRVANGFHLLNKILIILQSITQPYTLDNWPRWRQIERIIR